METNPRRAQIAGMHIGSVTLVMEDLRVPGGDFVEWQARAVRAKILGEPAPARPDPDAPVHVSRYVTALTTDQVAVRTTEVRAVRLADWEAGIVYDVHLDGEDSDLRACGFTVTVADGGDLKGADLIGMTEAVMLAKRYLRGDLPDYITDRDYTSRGGRYRRPELAKVATAYLEATTARAQRRPGVPRLSVREHIRRTFGAASLQTVDGWIRAARDADLIPAASTGKPRRTTPKETPDA